MRNPAGTVTVASAPGQTAEAGGVTLASAGAVSNLTFEGIRFSGGVEVDGLGAQPPVSVR